MSHFLHTVILAAASAIPVLVAASSPCTAKENYFSPAQALVKRVTPEYADKVTFRQNKKLQQPTIGKKKNKLVITARNVKEAIRAY